MKKVIGAVSTVAIASAATLPSFAHTNFGGFYVGGQAGVAVGNNDVKFYEDVASPTGVITTDNGGNGFAGGLHAGWGQMMNAFYFGLELAWIFSGLKGDYKNDDAKASLSMCDMVTAMIRLGYALDTAMFFLAFGWANAKWELKTTGFDYTKEKTSNRHNAFAFGVGAEFPVAEAFFLGFQMMYAHFNEKKHARTDGSNYIWKTCPGVFTFMLRGSWKFNTSILS